LHPSYLALKLTLTLTLIFARSSPRELLSAMLEEVSSEYVLLAVHGIGYLAR
jgi:hypothetical protein